LLIVHAVVLAAANLPKTVMAADDWPPLRKGMWEYHRTIETPGTPGDPKIMQFASCANPGEDMKNQTKQLLSICKISPLVRAGSSYTYSAECKIGEDLMISKSVLTVESGNAYSIIVETQTGTKATREVLKASLKGACP